MKKLLACTGALALLTGCVTVSPNETKGQLFCAVATQDGPIVVALVDAAASFVPGAGPVAILATGAAKLVVDADCAAAGGIAVSPPPNPATAPVVAIVPPAAPVSVTPEPSS